MQVSIETTSGLERRLKVGIPAEEIESEVEKRLKQAAKTVRLNGFRKGKVPLKVVKQRFGANVRQEVLGDAINRSFYEAVQKEEVKPAGQPSIEPTQMSEGKDIEFIATFEVYPDVAVGDFSSFEITKLVADVVESDIDKMIEILRVQQAQWQEIERSAVKEDQVNIDYHGTKDGEDFEGGQAQGQNLELGSKSMIAGFEDGIVGMKAGEEKVLKLTFPDDYHAEALQGAAVEFAVKVNCVSEKVPPPVDEEFFAKYGVTQGGEEKFREEIKANMQRELNSAAKSKVKNQVMEALLSANQVELPKALVAREIEALRGQMIKRFNGQTSHNLDMKSLLPDEMFGAQAERRVALGLIVGEVVRQTKISVNSERVRAMIEELASTYQDPQEIIKYYYGNQQLLAGIESAVLEDQVVDHIIQAATIKEEQSSYEDVVKQEESAQIGE